MWLLHRLKNHVFLKISALILSIFIWSWVQVNEETTLPLKLNLTYEKPDDLIEKTELPKVVLVELTGSKGLIKSLNEIYLETKIDLSDSVEGYNHIDLSTQFIQGIPNGVSISRYTPPGLDISFDKPMIRNLPIRANIVGTPAKDWIISNIEIEPKFVAIRGPRQFLENLVDIPTKIINIDQIQKSRNFKMGLSLPSKILSIENKTEITVNIEIESKNVNHKLQNIPVVYGDVSKQISPIVVDLTLSVPREIEIPQDIQLYIAPEKRKNKDSKEIVFGRIPNSPFQILGFPDAEHIQIIDMKPTLFTIGENNDTDN